MNTFNPNSTYVPRIALTGGPGGGKTTAADLFRRELGDQVVIVPEAATILYRGGFPRLAREDVRKTTQKAIFQMQTNLEDVYCDHYQSRVLLCDRGTVDGAAYWPGSEQEFFSAMSTTLETELERYDAVLFFETAAVGGIAIEGGNAVRIESLEEAVRLDQKLRRLWSKHKKFTLVPHERSFLKKISSALTELSKQVTEIRSARD